jgi:hypothetical protein
MTAVAAVAVLTGLGVRADRLRQRTRYHREQEAYYGLLAFGMEHRCGTMDLRDELLTFEKKPGGGWLIRPASPEAERILEARARWVDDRTKAFRRLEAYHARRARECARAALRPWAIVSGERPPPEPE